MMMAAEVQLSPSFAILARNHLFEGRYLSNSNRTIYDIHPDGQRFLMIQKGNEEALGQQVNVVFNWFEELNRLVPGE